MARNDKIWLLKNHEIDKSKWDATLTDATNSMVYGWSFYLDAMSAGWMAMADENYDWVLPLTHRQKFGITYLYQPAFMQQLGVFSKPDIKVPWLEICNALQEHFRFGEMFWNYQTNLEELPFSVFTKASTNYVLDLSKNYADISSAYHKDLVKNLKRAERQTLHFCETNDHKKAIDLYQMLYGKRFPHVTNSDYQHFEAVCEVAKKRNFLQVFEMQNDLGECLSTALLLKDDIRIYNIMNTTTEAGRSQQANHLLMDHIIRHFSNTPVILDFEGSDLPGVKSFYENFGAINQPFYFVKYNKLPWPLNLLKR